jgi:hypothetical protein
MRGFIFILIKSISRNSFSILICPSSCYTTRYLTNQNEYPIFGNETYSGVCFVLLFYLKIKK